MSHLPFGWFEFMIYLPSCSAMIKLFCFQGFEFMVFLLLDVIIYLFFYFLSFFLSAPLLFFFYLSSALFLSLSCLFFSFLLFFSPASSLASVFSLLSKKFIKHSLLGQVLAFEQRKQGMRNLTRKRKKRREAEERKIQRKE